MPFRPRVDCLWCGQAWETRSPDDLEGWAALCPACLGQADENGFLRARLRTALRGRAAAAASAAGASGVTERPGTAAAAAITTPGDWEDWYLRRGSFSRGPVYDGPWSMELDEVTHWLDGQRLGGTIVELGAGMGWWTGLLAEKGELWVYDDDATSLEAARSRLVAHGLLAHLHQRDVLAAPDKQVDAVFAAYLLGAAPSRAALRARVSVVRRWLRPGGAFVFVEARAGDDEADLAGPGRSLRTFTSESLVGSLEGAGFGPVETGHTRSSFIFGRAVVPA
jgi:SAM-dependent methyltransferase